ncbi:MAG: DUF3817 domain-containing protein [Campylobacterota bacterium]|nr:DUF3817 domain-containing protein [Campylobacterota bacterium]
MSELKKFRLINKIEGYSFIILLFIAMPLKYSFGFPIATKIAGMTHGILFMGFVYQLLEAMKDVPFSKKESLIYFILSLVPFGSFYTEKLCKEKEPKVAPAQ